MSSTLGRQNSATDVTRRPVLSSYDDYAEAQKAVDTLSDKGFPVQNVAIVGVDLRIVESVIARLTWGRAAMSSMFTGAWFGLLIGLFVGLFSSTTDSVLPLVALGLIYGAAFGIVLGLVTHAISGGKRDFVSRQQLQATRYDVLCERAVIGEARKILGLGSAWPPEPPAPETGPTTAPLPDGDGRPGGVAPGPTDGDGVPPAAG